MTPDEIDRAMRGDDEFTNPKEQILAMPMEQIIDTLSGVCQSPDKAKLLIAHLIGMTASAGPDAINTLLGHLDKVMTYDLVKYLAAGGKDQPQLLKQPMLFCKLPTQGAEEGPFVLCVASGTEMDTFALCDALNEYAKKEKATAKIEHIGTGAAEYEKQQEKPRNRMRFDVN